MSTPTPRYLETGRTLSPFGDEIRQLPLLGRSLRARQNLEIAASGLTPDRLTLTDNAFVGAPVLKRWAERAGHGPSRLGLRPDHPSLALLRGSAARLSTRGAALDVFLNGPSFASLDELRELPVLYLEGVDVPRVGLRMRWPGRGHIAAQVERWPHFLRLAPRLVELELERRRGARRRSKALHPSWVAKDADVHPRAFLDGAIVESGAVVGEGAAVINSYLGPGAVLSDLARIRGSVLEANTHVLTDARFTDVVAMGRGSLASVGLQNTLLGRDVFLTSGVIFWNSPEGVSDGPPVGGCAGHGSVLGARTIVAPGVGLPNRTTIVMRREEGVQRVAAGPSVPACWDDAALVPVASLSGR